jgi:hypothetical protein
MFDRRHPLGWLFYLLLAVLISPAQTLETSTVSDTVYRADGTLAGGTLLISWPTFSTSAGQSVAAGKKSVTLEPGGALSVALVPNAAGTFYTVVYQLDGQTVKTEFWVVTSTSPTTIAAVRTVLGSGNSATPPATQQYVESLVASKANDAVVVHKSGSETIAGIKLFSVPPNVPTPVQPTDAVNKAYVDTEVEGSVQAGPFVFAQDPGQCTGSFATGIQANGDANCSTADVIQIAETTPTSGIANYGLFWFDSSCHCPKVISNNGQAIQLGLLNVFNADANTLEGLFGGRSGAEKKDAAMSFISAALQLSDAVTARHIIDEDKFKLGLSNVIDGVVLCLKLRPGRNRPSRKLIRLLHSNSLSLSSAGP